MTDNKQQPQERLGQRQDVRSTRFETMSAEGTFYPRCLICILIASVGGQEVARPELQAGHGRGAGRVGVPAAGVLERRKASALSQGPAAGA